MIEILSDENLPNYYRLIICINLILLAGMIYFSFKQPTIQRTFCAVVFILSIITLVLFSIYVELAELAMIWRYGSAAFTCLTVVLITSQLTCIPDLLPKLHIICLVSIALNGLGYWLWYSYQHPVFYDISFIVIYMYTIILFRTREHMDEFGNNSDSFGFHFNPSKVFLCISNRKSKA